MSQPPQQQKKKKNKKKGIPDRWLDYCPVGRRIPGTRFIAFKVPLKPSLNCQVPGSHSFGLRDLLDSVESQNQELGLIIDLTFTTRYYAASEVPGSCSYVKIPTEGHRVPSAEAILSFKRAVRQFLMENRVNDRLIGVHCTHGLNRTGYLICRYLIDVDGLDPAAALQLFNTSRGHCIERKNYLHDLLTAAKRSNEGVDKPVKSPVMRLAVEKGPPAAIKQGEKAVTSTPARMAKLLVTSQQRISSPTRNNHPVDEPSVEFDVGQKGGQEVFWWIRPGRRPPPPEPGRKTTRL